MKKCIIALLVLISLGQGSMNSQSPKEKGLQAITPDMLRGQLEFLASDWTEGRGTGDRGSYLAADYIASMFRVFGVSAGGDQGGMSQFGSGRIPRNQPGSSGRFGPPPRSYFQDFTLIESLPGGASKLTVTKAGKSYTFDEGIDFMVSRASMSSSFEGPLVFVGYGISDKANGIDDFAGVDVKGKIVLRLSGYPGINDNTSPMYKKLIGDNPRNAFEITRKKSEILASLGAAGAIDIVFNSDIAKRWGVYRFDVNMSPAESGQRTNWTPMRLDGKELTSSPVTITVTERVINLLLKDSGIDIAKYEKDAAAGTVKFKPLILPSVTAGMNIEVKSRRVYVRNVIAMIEGENPNEYVAIGAHMDHMGMDNGRIWNGADDNASGTVGVMAIAKAFAATGVKPKRTVLFCAWTGEEKGLLGSEYFTLYPTVGKIGDCKLYINFDMIGRDAANDTLKNKKEILYTRAYPKLEEITRQNRDQYKINLNITYRSTETPAGGSDYTAFAENKVPVISWVSTLHPEYHQSNDHISLINWTKMLEVTKLGFLQLWDAANGEIK